MSARVPFGIVGSQFQADIHAASIRMGCHGTVAAVASPTPGNAEHLAQQYEIDRIYRDYRDMLADPNIDAITIAAPNVLHAQVTIDAAHAGKHVVVEKPLCMTLEEADAMIEACDRAGVKAKEMADQGAFGDVYLVKQSEMHFGPHGDWFWDVDRSGGGVFMDMGCHGLAFV